MSFQLPMQLSSEIRKMVKPLGTVRLLARNGLAFTPRTAPIHRFMLAQAMCAGSVIIEEGELSDDGDHLTAINSSGQRSVDEEVVVARHGTKKAIEGLLPPEDAKRLRRR